MRLKFNHLHILFALALLFLSFFLLTVQNVWQIAAGALALLVALLFIKRALTPDESTHQIAGHLGQIEIRGAVFKALVDRYFCSLFPENSFTTHTYFRGKQLTIKATLPTLPQERRQQLIEQIKTELPITLKELTGLTDPYSLLITFSPPSNVH